MRAKLRSELSSSEELTVCPSAIAFAWHVGRDMWIKAAYMAPHMELARQINWLGVASLAPDDTSRAAEKRALFPGAPAALWGIEEQPELNGQVRLLSGFIFSLQRLTRSRCECPRRRA